MGTVFAFTDISYLTAVSLTLGVVALLINAILSIIPYSDPRWVQPTGLALGQGILAVVGCCFFFVSSFLSFVEAVNANRRGCFGWRREHMSYHDANDASLEHGAVTRMVPDWDIVRKTNNFGNLFGHSSHSDAENRSTDNLCGASTKDSGQDKNQWRWFPTNRELWKHL